MEKVELGTISSELVLWVSTAAEIRKKIIIGDYKGRILVSCYQTFCPHRQSSDTGNITTLKTFTNLFIPLIC